LILASSSPRRREFMERLGLEFCIRAADIDETPLPDEEPAALAVRLAENKAQAVARRLSPDELPTLIIAADTVVAVENTLLGKPATEDEAWEMLRALRHRDHHVISAVSVLDAATGRQETRFSDTVVAMRNYRDDEIAAYIASGDPFDKAGGYAIQHADFHPVESVAGCVAGVIGLPLGELTDLLAAFGVAIPDRVAPICRLQTGFSCCRADDDHQASRMG
jgi:septum formation protein